MITLDRELLTLAAKLPRIHQEYEYSSMGAEKPIPPDYEQDGFKLIGSGSERTVWLGPDGQVYKVQALNGWTSNVDEARASRRHRRNKNLPYWIYIPETEYDEVTGIAVTEYIRGTQPWECYYDTCVCEGTCRWEAANEAFDFLGSCDGHAGNCVIIECNSPSDFIVAVIDFTR